tara:strand:+ start:482 stop:682 length:201 start_codon:yes stop_codon:yes gene_type:complete
MKKLILNILSVIIYIVVWWILAGLSIGINFAIFGRGTGGITAVGGLLSFWLSYKLVKWLRKEYLYM